MRDEIFRGGIPLLIAGVCFLALLYLARIRKERFLAYWTAAWALLLSRYAWTTYWGSPYPEAWMTEVGAILRLGFALSVFAGALELRGRRIAWTWVALGALLLPLTAAFVAWGLPTVTAAILNRAVMTGLILLAAGQLIRARDLPALERSVTAGSLAVYGVLSGVLPNVATDGALLYWMLMTSWALQLFIGIGMIAMYFRVSFDAELRRQRQLGTNLTEVLSGFLSICMHCKAIRDENARWEKLETYVANRSPTVFSHGLCDGCAASKYDVRVGEV